MFLNIMYKRQAKNVRPRQSETLKQSQVDKFSSDKQITTTNTEYRNVNKNDKNLDAGDSGKKKTEMECNHKCEELEKKLADVEDELEKLKSEKLEWLDKEILYELKEQQIRNELCEMSQLYNGLCNVKLPEETGDTVAVLTNRLQKAQMESNTTKFQISVIELQLKEAMRCNKHLQKCLENTQRQPLETESLGKKTISQQDQQPKYENKEIQATEYFDFQNKLKNIIASLELEECKKSLFLSSLNQTDNLYTLIHHMKLVYNEFITTNKCNKELGKQLKCMEALRNDLIKGKEKLEKRLQKLSELCKAFQALSEVQEKEIRHCKDIKMMISERTEKCELLTRRLAELEITVEKTKKKKNFFKKKYFKERHSIKKKTKKKTENWLTKIFDWRVDN